MARPIRRLAVLGAVLALLACSPPRAESGPAGSIVDGPHSAPAPTADPDTPVSSPASRLGAYVPPKPANPDDPCEAKRFQWLVGKPRTEIPTPPPNRQWRTHSTEDAVTEDYSETRMNILWDAATGRVLEVKCG